MAKNIEIALFMKCCPEQIGSETEYINLAQMYGHKAYRESETPVDFVLSWQERVFSKIFGKATFRLLMAETKQIEKYAETDLNHFFLAWYRQNIYSDWQPYAAVYQEQADSVRL